MKTLFVTLFCLMALQSQAQNTRAKAIEDFKNKREAVGKCTYKFPYQFKVGDRFIFEKNPTAIKENWELFFFYKTDEMGKMRGNRQRLNRKNYDGKIAKLISIIDTSFAFLDRETYFTFEIEETGEHISHRVAFSNKGQQNDQYLNGGKDQIVTLPYLIYLPEIDSFKANYMGKTVYSNFMVGEKRYEKVKIINVGAGTDKAPIRVVYATDKGDIGYTDICTCGTNIPSSIIDDIYFEKRFFVNNPKNNFKGTDKAWESIQLAEIEVGMTENELVMAWGAPLNILQGKNTKQYVYHGENVNVENGKIKDFDSMK